MRIWCVQNRATKFVFESGKPIEVYDWRKEKGKPERRIGRRFSLGTYNDPDAWKSHHTGFGFNHPPEYFTSNWKRLSEWIVCEMADAQVFIERNRQEQIDAAEEYFNQYGGDGKELGYFGPQNEEGLDPGWYYRWSSEGDYWGPHKTEDDVYLAMYQDDNAIEAPPTVTVGDIPWNDLDHDWTLPEEWESPVEGP